MLLSFTKPVKKYLCNTVLLITLIVSSLITPHVLAGDLANFEREAKTKQSSTKNSSSKRYSQSSSGSDSDEDKSIGDEIVGALAEAVVRVVFSIVENIGSAAFQVLEYGSKNSIIRTEMFFNDDNAGDNNKGQHTLVNQPTEQQLKTTEAMDKNVADLSDRKSKKEPKQKIGKDLEPNPLQQTSQTQVSSLAQKAEIDVMPKEQKPYKLTAKMLGERAIPFARLDISRGLINSDITANDLNLELGFSLFSLNHRQSKLKESTPSDELTLKQTMFNFRPSFTEKLQLNLGFGYYSLQGESKLRSSAYKLGLGYYNGNRQGMGGEYQFIDTLRGDLTLTESDWSLHYGFPFAGVKVGYRKINSAGQSLSGPYAGMMLYF